MNEEHLIKSLEEGTTYFLYQKKDGHLRGAKGTRTEGHYSEEWDKSRDVVTYWDLRKDDYRCFKDGNLLIEIPNIFRGVKKLFGL